MQSRHIARHAPTRLYYWLVPVVLIATVAGGARWLGGTSWAAPLAQEEEPARPQGDFGEWQLDTVENWSQGFIEGLLITNNDGGELRLDAEQAAGVFVSEPFAAQFPFNAVGAIWRAEIPESTQLTLEVRGRAGFPPDGGGSDDGWSEWRTLEAGDATTATIPGRPATPDVLDFAPDTTTLQLRATFDSVLLNASAVLEDITLVYLNTTQGPPTSPGLPAVAADSAPSTTTSAPQMVRRATWTAFDERASVLFAPPNGVILHQIATSADFTDTLPLLRALLQYQRDSLQWDDLSYHYLIDQQGTLYQGRLGGPAAVVPRLAGGDTVVHVALIAPAEEAPSDAATATLVALLAWLADAYGFDPQGTHELAVGGGVSGTVSERPNIAAHSEVVPVAPDPSQPVLDAIPAVRLQADQSFVRSQWFFGDVDTNTYTQQFAFRNLRDEDATVTLRFFDGSDDPPSAVLTVPANSNSTFIADDAVPETVNLAAIIEANRELVVDKTLALPTDISITNGVAELSRTWYFAEVANNATTNTVLVLFNPQDTTTDVVITYMRENGRLSTQQLTVPARQRVTLDTGDIIPNQGAGIALAATQPVLAERTTRTGSNAGGVHNSPGMTQLSQTWYFADGSTQEPYEMALALLNPNQQSAVATVTYLTPDGTAATRRYALPASTRLLVGVNEFVPDLSVASVVDADRPIAVERVLSFPPSVVLEGNEPPERISIITPGIDDTAFEWQFPPAPTIEANQFLLVGNPGRFQTRVTVDLVLTDGSTTSTTLVMPASSRATLAIHDVAPGEAAVSMSLRSVQPIVAERSVFPLAGTGAGGGTILPGVARR